jgi:outer membrane protein assembly factor BamE (lipoprotein component of BamABCDE complex)
MNAFFSITTRLFILFFALNLAACQSVDIRGQHVTDQAIDEINTKKLSENQVINLIGTPTYIPEYTPDTWYYVQRSSTRRAWFDPKVVEQRIVKITFSNSQAQSAVLITNSQNENIAINSDFTQTGGTEQNGVQKFVKNIGRFNKTTDGKPKRKKAKK